MNKTARNAGLALLAAGVLAYPAMRMYRYVKQRRQDSLGEPEQNNHKAFSPAYRREGPHKRKLATNGHIPH